MNDSLKNLHVPKISVVTACFNAENHIRQTLESVINQKYPNVEFIVVDGGSTDGTTEIISEYLPYIHHFISEPDKGQYDAIRKGFRLSSGDVLCWLNADDMYLPWTFEAVGQIFAQNLAVEWITGLPAFLDEAGVLTEVYSAPAAYPQEFIKNGWYDRWHGGFLQQESMFWRRSLWERSEGLDPSLTLAADFELWRSFSRLVPLIPVTIPLAAFRRLPGVQRSSLNAAVYDDEVARARSASANVPMMWRLLAKGGDVGRGLARALIFKRAPVVTYDQDTKKWVYLETIRSISRQSLSRLLLEYHNRKRKK